MTEDDRMTLPDTEPSPPQWVADLGKKIDRLAGAVTHLADEFMQFRQHTMEQFDKLGTRMHFAERKLTPPHGLAIEHAQGNGEGNGGE